MKETVSKGNEIMVNDKTEQFEDEDETRWDVFGSRVLYAFTMHSHSLRALTDAKCGIYEARGCGKPKKAVRDNQLLISSWAANQEGRSSCGVQNVVRLRPFARQSWQTVELCSLAQAINP